MDDVEFDYFLAERLGWGSVEELRAGMSAAEHLRWQLYYARQGQRRELDG